MINKMKTNYTLHPSITLKEKLEELKMTPQELAIKTGLSVDTILSILNRESVITPEIANRLEKALSIPASFWIAKQLNYNLFAVPN
jgi:addiction module HigA family antidote